MRITSRSEGRVETDPGKYFIYEVSLFPGTGASSGFVLLQSLQRRSQDDDKGRRIAFKMCQIWQVRMDGYDATVFNGTHVSGVLDMRVSRQSETQTVCTTRYSMAGTSEGNIKKQG